ncbi:exodeoxyribonuclease VII large subunit [Candidatus Poriferisocius sp.]|uniref:exodeoxyribonuclease VII large subunit n=1 Tax=Candidatus Poriferisocius sp. TaxID=3101276 RepID=UPI003B015767
MSLFSTTSAEETGEPMAFTVAQLADRIKQVLNGAFDGELEVEGEIRNLGRARSGHMYFDLVEPPPATSIGKQPEASVSVALFKFNRARVEETLSRYGNMVMEDGMKVRIRGELDFWPPRGQLRVRMTGIDPRFTLGELEAERQRLLEKLRDEGLLTRNRAVPFPLAPLRIGLVTSNGSAAHRDFCEELEASGLAWEVVLVDTPVQGMDAPARIAAAIARAGRAGVDVIAVVRGGGARTDLVAFDDEAVARAIAAAPVPVLTGIGHEIDRTIADEVAHEAQKTPTACAGFVVTAARNHLVATEQAWNAITARTERLLDDSGLLLATVSRTTARAAEDRLRRAGNGLDGRAGRIRDLAQNRTRIEVRRVDTFAGTARHRAAAAVTHGRRTLEQARLTVATRARRTPAAATRDLANLEDRLRLLDPRVILARGWSITRHRGKVVRDPASLGVGEELITTLARGDLHSTVSENRP